MINRIRKYFQARRDEQARLLAKAEADRRWLAYLRRNRVIMPAPKPDDRSSIAMHQRILARQ